MARKVRVQLVDDLDGTQSDDISTVSFGLDGATYEIDLTEANSSNLRSQLEEFVAHARRAGGRKKRGTASAVRTGSAAFSREQAQAIREWARRKGFDISDRGRIRTNIIEAFEAAQAEAKTKTRKRKIKASAAA